jgi:hypothetical protein
MLQGRVIWLELAKTMCPVNLEHICWVVATAMKVVNCCAPRGIYFAADGNKYACQAIQQISKRLA